MTLKDRILEDICERLPFGWSPFEKNGKCTLSEDRTKRCFYYLPDKCWKKELERPGEYKR